METFSALLAICAGNSPVPGEFPAQRPVTRNFDVFFDLRLNKRLSKQSWGWYLRRYHAHYDVTIMGIYCIAPAPHVSISGCLKSGVYLAPDHHDDVNRLLRQEYIGVVIHVQPSLIKKFKPISSLGCCIGYILNIKSQQFSNRSEIFIILQSHLLRFNPYRSASIYRALGE